MQQKYYYETSKIQFKADKKTIIPFSFEKNLSYFPENLSIIDIITVLPHKYIKAIFFPLKIINHAVQLNL